MSNQHDIEIGPQERNLGEKLRGFQESQCPPADDLVGFVEHKLAQAAHDGVLRHLGHCNGCRVTVMELRTAEKAMVSRSGFSFHRLLPVFGILSAAAAAAAVSAVFLRAQTTPKPIDPQPFVAMNDGPPKHAVGVKPPKASKSPSATVVTKVSPKNLVREPELDETKPEKMKEPEVKATVKDPTKGSSAVKSAPPVSSGSTVPPPTPPDVSTPPSIKPGGGDVAVASSESNVSSEKIYALVGPGHTFALDSPDSHEADRQRIEQTYADMIRDAKDDFDRRIDQGNDAAAETDSLNERLAELAKERDEQLEGYFPLRNDLRAKYPELRIDGQGPYQVVALDTIARGETRTVQKVVVHAPWSGYPAYERPYGWSYGVPYSPTEFRQVYLNWHRRYVAAGARAYPHLIGRSGRINVDIRLGADRRFVVNAPSSSPAWGGAARPTTRSSFGGSRPSFGSERPSFGGSRPSYGSERAPYPSAGAGGYGRSGFSHSAPNTYRPGFSSGSSHLNRTYPRPGIGERGNTLHPREFSSSSRPVRENRGASEGGRPHH